MTRVIKATRIIKNARLAKTAINRFSLSMVKYQKLQRVASFDIYNELRKRQRQIDKAKKNVDKVKKIADKAGKITDHLQKGRYAKISASFGRIMGFVLPLISLGLSVGNFLLLKTIQESDLRKLQVIDAEFNRIQKFQSRFDSRIKANTRRIDQLNDDADLFNSQIINNRKLIKDNLEINKILNGTIQKGIASFDKRLRNIVNQVNVKNRNFENKLKQIENKTRPNAPSQKLDNARIASNSKKINQIQSQTKTFESKILDNAKRITVNSISINQLKSRLANNVNTTINRINNSIRQVKNEIKNQKQKNIEAEILKLLQPKIDKTLEIDRLKSRDLGRSLEKIQTKTKKIEQQVKKGDDTKLDKRRFEGFEIGFPGNVLKISSSYVEARLKEFESQIKFPDVDLGFLENLIGLNRKRINDLDNKSKEQLEVDKLSNLKIDKLIGLVGLIPARSAQETTRQLAPRIPDLTAAGVCKTTRPGGCMSKALDSNSNGLKDFLKGQFGGILDKLNAAANAAQLALLKKIDFKLGAQIGTKGISGAIQGIFENKLVDRAMSVVTLATTMHNALMLSNSLGQTLFSATDNILNVFGVKIKDEKGSEIGIQKVVDSLLLNFANTLFGADNVKTLNANLKKANRIYQSGANIVNSVRSMTDSVRNITEFTAENTGKIGNALKTYQVIAPDAYKWMPEQVNGQSIWVQRLQNLEEAASGIEMVSSEIIQIQENAREIVEQKKEFDKAIEELAPKERVDNKPVAKIKVAEKAASVAPAVPAISSDADKEKDEE